MAPSGKFPCSKAMLSVTTLTASASKSSRRRGLVRYCKSYNVPQGFDLNYGTCMSEVV